MKNIVAFFFITTLLVLNAHAKPDTPNSTLASKFGVKVVDVKTANDKYKSGAVFVDTRKVPEYAIEHIKGSISAFYDEKGGNANKRVDFDNTNDIYHDKRISTDKSKMFTGLEMELGHIKKLGILLMV